MKITLLLHDEDDMYLLESQDIYKYIGESTEKERKFVFYIDVWCQYLNYPLIHNDEMAFGDTELSRLEGWINGFNFCKGIDPIYYSDKIIIKYEKYLVSLSKPHK